jgi:pimeloyl-ACP methyl ester carboxylesterase
MRLLTLILLAAALAWAAHIQAEPGTTPERPIGCASRGLDNGSFYAELGGVRVHYEVRGKGPVIMVLPNSWGLSLQGLRGLLRGLEERFTMVYFDPRGMGESGPARDDSDRSLVAVRDDFDALRRHLRIRKVNALGWSNGAINLIALASEKPDILASAIFLHGAASVTAEDVARMAREHASAHARYEKFFRALEKRRPGPDADARLKKFYVDEAFPEMCADGAATHPKIREAFAGASFGYAHTILSMKELPTFDYRNRLSKITARCLVLAGAADLIPAAKSRETADGIPGAHFRLFERSGHFAPLEEPEAFATAVSGFLAEENDWKTHILDLERWALDRWGEGDPDGFLAISDPEVTYFDPTLAVRLDGLDALRTYYEAARGKMETDRYEMLNPRVELFWDAAVLSYNLLAVSGGRESRWNCTEVYRRTPKGWRILQTHWSQTQAIKGP